MQCGKLLSCEKHKCLKGCHRVSERSDMYLQMFANCYVLTTIVDYINWFEIAMQYCKIVKNVTKLFKRSIFVLSLLFKAAMLGRR